MIGLLTLLAAYVHVLRPAWMALRAHVGLDGLWAMTCLIMLFLGNMTESSIHQSPLVWAIFVAVASMPRQQGSGEEIAIADGGSLHESPSSGPGRL